MLKASTLFFMGSIFMAIIAMPWRNCQNGKWDLRMFSQIQTFISRLHTRYPHKRCIVPTLSITKFTLPHETLHRLVSSCLRSSAKAVQLRSAQAGYCAALPRSSLEISLTTTRFRTTAYTFVNASALPTPNPPLPRGNLRRHNTILGNENSLAIISFC